MEIHNEIEWVDDERGGHAYTSAPLPGNGVAVVDDITNLSPIVANTVFHTRSLHISGTATGAITEVGFYDGNVVAGSLRWHIYLGAAAHVEFNGLRSMRFHSTILVNLRNATTTTSTTVFVHIGGVLRNN